MNTDIHQELWTKCPIYYKGIEHTLGRQTDREKDRLTFDQAGSVCAREREGGKGRGRGRGRHTHTHTHTHIQSHVYLVHYWVHFPLTAMSLLCIH